MYNPFSLIGKTILITGASSGIGRATAIDCSRMGALCILTGRNEGRLLQTKEQLDGTGHITHCCDLNDETAVKELCTLLPSLDGVVHCAGISMLKPILGITDSNLHSVFETNCFAPMLLTKHIVKSKKMNTAGSMVFISSISGNSNVATALSVYGASKSALSSFVRYAALELSGKQIRCNAILPGRIETSLLQNQTMNDAKLQQDMSKYPLRRYGTPQEVAQSVIYLLSDATKWVTGTSLTIDGGRSLI